VTFSSEGVWIEASLRHQHETLPLVLFTIYKRIIKSFTILQF